MKLVKTLILFIILAILAGYVYFYEIKGGEEREKTKKLEEQVFNFENDSVKTVEIRSALQRFYFEKTEDGWKILKPIETDGEKSTIDGLVNTLKNLKKIREFSIKQNELKDYGLVGRSTLVILTFTNGTRDSVRFGDETPVGSNVFANKEDTLVFMVSAYTKNNVTKSLFDFRNKEIAKVKQADVREFKLKNHDGEFYLVKEGDDWFLKSPVEKKADKTTVSTVLRKMEYGKAKSVVSETLENPKKYRLDKPAYQLDIYLGENKAHKKVIFSSLKDNISYAKDESRPQIFTVDSTYIKDLDKTLFELRNKNFAEYDKDQADSIVVSQGDSLLSFVKDTSNIWLYNGDRKVKQWKVTSLLNTINTLRAKKFLMENTPSPNGFGLAHPERIITVFSKGTVLQELRLASPGDDQKVAFCPSTKVVAEIEKSTYNNLEVKLTDFLEEKKPVSEDIG